MAFNKAKALQEAEKFVGQGKISLAIKEYLHIVEKDPSDVSLLNTVGDLYAREKNIPEALKHFHRLAEAYVREGFTVKAVAIYKKISKLDPNSVDLLLKLAELYSMQGLGREAREQYAQAIDFYRKKNQNDKALEIFRKVVQLDPENILLRDRLAELCEQMGKKADAAQVYLDTAELALRRTDNTAAEAALVKAGKLDAENPKAHLLRARLALIKQRPGEVEKLINSSPGLGNRPAAQQLLLEAYLATEKLEAAEKLLLNVFRANPTDFAPLASFASLCIQKQNFDAALKPLTEVADQLIEQKNTGRLMEILRQIWAKAPQHVATLELIHRVCEKTADEFTLPEVLEALAHAHVQDGELEKAEACYQKLISREPENEHYKGLLNQVLQKLGKEVVAASPQGLADVELALVPEAEVSPASAPAAIDAEQAAAVKEAHENSDLFSRYGLVDKAVAELEKVLKVYPDQTDIHSRILELCRKNRPARAAQAAQALAQVYAQRGDFVRARKYEDMAGAVPKAARGGATSPPAAGVEFETPLPVTPPEPAAPEIELSAEAPVVPRAAGGAPPPQEIPLDMGAPPATAEEVNTGRAGAPEVQEFDLSGDLEAFTEAPSTPAAKPEAAPFNYEDSRVEIDFYLEQGFAEEAKKVIQTLEGKYPGDHRIAELGKRVEEHLSRPAAPAPATPPRAPSPQPMPAGAGPTPPAAKEERALPSSFPQPPQARAPKAAELASSPGVQPAVVKPVPGPAQAPPAGSSLLGSLAGDLESSLEGLQPPAPPPSQPARGEPAPARIAGSSASPLSDLLQELSEGEAETAAREDPETHYNLGVAFREMGLFDEAIGEFQKVVKGAQKGKLPPNFLQACSLLAVCFMDKKMPAIAAKWYLRALEAPGLDEEATLALQYDLAVAYEQAGDNRTALEKFSEVYSQNIDFRDVAEKIRSLQQKTS